jgi:hypothetical protein
MSTREFSWTPRVLALVTGCTAALASAPLHAQVQLLPDDPPSAPAPQASEPSNPLPSAAAAASKPYGVVVVGGFVASGVMIGAGIAMMIPGIWYALKNRTVVWTDVGGWLAARPMNVLRF